MGFGFRLLAYLPFTHNKGLSTWCVCVCMWTIRTPPDEQTGTLHHLSSLYECVWVNGPMWHLVLSALSAWKTREALYKRSPFTFIYAALLWWIYHYLKCFLLQSSIFYDGHWQDGSMCQLCQRTAEGDCLFQFHSSQYTLNATAEAELDKIFD